MQLVGHLSAASGSELSQASFALFTPSPQVAAGAQSESVPPFAGFLQPAAQQPSPDVQAVMVVWPQLRLHCAAVPVVLSVVQASLSLQLAGHLSAASGSELSQVSVPFFEPSPQTGCGAEQSLSFAFVQPGAQQPSPLTQVVMAV